MFDFCRRHDVRLAEAILAAVFLSWFLLIGAGWLATRFPQAWIYATLNALTAIAILALRPKLLAATDGPLFVLRHWYPVLFYGMFFLETSQLVPALNSRTFDAELIRADRALFGGADPTVLLERWHHPALTELLQLCYVSYYFLPLLAGGLVFRRRGIPQFHSALTCMSIGFYLSYICYFFVPAVGPRFEIRHSFELSGLLTFDFVRGFLHAAEGKMYDCFPSGHTAMTLITLVFAWRFYRPVFWWILPIAVGLIFSTVYLRYHYVVDLIAALPLVAVALLATPPLKRFWSRVTGDPPEDPVPAEARTPADVTAKQG